MVDRERKDGEEESRREGSRERAEDGVEGLFRRRRTGDGRSDKSMYKLRLTSLGRRQREVWICVP